MATDPFDATRDWLPGLRELQEQYVLPVTDAETQTPAVALQSLRDAVELAPDSYREYLGEAVACYEGAQYRASVLMVWSATMQHLFDVVDRRKGGIKAIEAANLKRNGLSKGYRQMRKTNDLLYLQESSFILLGEDAGMYNRNARKFLIERLDLRNLCGHPTGYRPGREQTVIFIESLLLNIVSGGWLDWA